ncbi:hypothetical protein OROGR_013771 [Orobanche gracilis]
MSTPPKSRSTSPVKTTSRRTRQSTRCRDMTKTRVDGKKLPLDFDMVTEKIKRAHKVKLSTYLGKLARDNVSILHPRWVEVPESAKNMIWQDVLSNFDISNIEQLKEKILQSVGLKWRQFKSELTRDWIYGAYKDMSPCEKYNISETDWDEFKKIRLDSSWEVKRKKAQDIQKLNTAPHIMSRGGYDWLEEKIIEKKLKQRQVEAKQSGNDTIVDPPSPPTRHQKYKLGRIKKSGEMTSDAACEIAKRIDELEEQYSHGSFVNEGRKDILSVAVGRPEHPGRVRGVGGGVGIREYFGGRSSGSALSQGFLERLTQKITQEVSQNLMKQFGPALESLNQSQHTPVDNDTPPLRVSTKGSCIAATNPSGEDTNVDKVDRVELYIDEHPPRLVALGRVIEGGPTLHGVPLSGDLVRVTVEEVRDTDAPVPVPTSEVCLLGQAVGGFIAWPKRLIKSVLAQDIDEPKKKRVRPVDNSEPVQNPLLELLKISASLYENPLSVPLDDFFGLVDTEVPLYICHTDVLEIFQGNDWLSISVMQLWIMYLKSQIVNTENHNLYGFLEPQSIQSMGNKKSEATSYIIRHIRDSRKQIFLGAYHQRHWQLLVILPKQGTASKTDDRCEI